MSGARWRTTTTSASRPAGARRPEREPRASLGQTPSGNIAGWCLFFRAVLPPWERVNAESPVVRRQGEHLGGARLFLADRGDDPVHLLGRVLALRARDPTLMGVRHPDLDGRDR